MIDKYNWFALVQRLGKLGRSLTGAFYFFTAGGVPAPNYVKLVVNQYRFVIQQANALKVNPARIGSLRS